MEEVRELVTRIAADMQQSCEVASVCGIPVRSLFLIGSCSQKEFDNYWFQDFDIHFLIDSVDIGRDSVLWLRERLATYRSWSTNMTLVDSAIRDRHWKMVPVIGLGNIGLHATLLSSVDHFRRLHYNPLLAENMYRRCRVLWGEHPRKIRGFRRPSISEYMHSVGGIGWMLENFARAVTLWCTERGDRSFYPYVGGYCWNVVSTLLFHLVTLETGKLSGRGDAIQVYLPEMTRPVADAAAMVTERRYTPDTDIIDIEEHWDVTAQVADWIVDRIATKRPHLFSQSAPPPGPVYMAERYGSALTRAWSHPRSIPIVDVVRKPGESYVASIRDALDLARAEVGPDVTAKEQFELLRDLRAGRASAKVRIWDRASWVRRQRSHDFDLDRGWATDAAVWFGWEDGAQALLQRLHEHLGNQGDEGGELCALSDLCAAIVAEHAGVDPPTASGFDAVAEWLGEHLSAMMPLVDL